jgi:hypothetical protein
VNEEVIMRIIDAVCEETRRRGRWSEDIIMKMYVCRPDFHTKKSNQCE